MLVLILFGWYNVSMASIEDFKKIELVVAQIKEVKEHPNADRLYVLQVDTGRDVRQIVAGVRMAYTPEQLMNRRIILIANMEPAVIRGETYHFELVSNESGAGISRIGLDYGIPIANAVLTTENDAQAQARMQEKGRDAARVAVEMANLVLALEELAENAKDVGFDA